MTKRKLLKEWFEDLQVFITVCEHGLEIHGDLKKDMFIIPWSEIGLAIESVETAKEEATHILENFDAWFYPEFELTTDIKLEKKT